MKQYTYLDMRRENRVVRKTQWFDEQKMIEFQEKPLAIYCAGGYPKICKRTIETHHEGDTGFDFAEVAFIVDNEPKWLVDSDLITPAERKQVIKMCREYGTEKPKRPKLYEIIVESYPIDEDDLLKCCTQCTHCKVWHDSTLHAVYFSKTIALEDLADLEKHYPNIVAHVTPLSDGWDGLIF